MAILEDVRVLEQTHPREVVMSFRELLLGHFCTWLDKGLFSGQLEDKRMI